MTWLYVPSPPSSGCAQASEASNSASCLASIFADAMCAGSVTWRGKPLRPLLWSRRWMRGGFIRHLSGATLPHSTAQAGVDAFIASLPAIRAKATASRESGSEPMTNGSLPITSCPSWTPCGLIVSSVKTSRGTLRSSSKHSAAHWNAWVIALRREYSARAVPAIRTGASDSSSWRTARTAHNWPTPTVLLSGESTDPAVFAARQAMLKERHKGRTGNGAGPDLAMIAKTWATPTAHDGRRPGADLHSTQGGNLSREAANWPTPAARDHKGTNSTEHVETNGSGRMHLDQLPNFVAYCLPPLFQDRSIPDGAISSTAGHNLPRPSTSRKLNPYFVEALMRWPSGLSGFARAETAWTRWWALMPGFVLALCSDSSEPAGPAQGQLL